MARRARSICRMVRRTSPGPGTRRGHERTHPTAPSDLSEEQSKRSYDQDRSDLLSATFTIGETEFSAISSTRFVGGSMHVPSATVNREVGQAKAQSLSYVVLLAATTAISGFLFGF